VFEFWILDIESCLVIVSWNLEFHFVSLRTKWGEEGEDDARSAWPSDTLGHTRDTMAATTGCDGESPSQSLEKQPQFG